MEMIDGARARLGEALSASFDEELGRYASPSLSTVTIDLERQGGQAMRRLLALVRGEEPPEPETSSLHALIPRESSGPAPARAR